jgi:hypothetical protein
MWVLYWPSLVKLGRSFGQSGYEFAVDDSVRSLQWIKGEVEWEC